MSDHTTETASRGKLTDSPWFWGYLFCTMGLVLLVAFQAKLVARQQEIDREGFARQVAMGRSPSVGNDRQSRAEDRRQPVTTAQPSPRMRLRYLYALFAVALVVAWIRLWWVHFGRSRTVYSNVRRSPADGSQAVVNSRPGGSS